jgi:hypothetical protein
MRWARPPETASARVHEHDAYGHQKAVQPDPGVSIFAD